jgi:hypothetical protein
VLDRVLGVFGKLPMRRGAWAWFHDIWICGARFLEYKCSFGVLGKISISKI